MARVLVIGDTHAPAMRESYPDFLEDMYEAWNCDRIVHIGDGADFHGISYHLKHTDLPNIDREIELAATQLATLYERFPNVDYLTGNHTDLPNRQAQGVGLPAKMMRTLGEILDMPEGWNVHPRFYDLMIDGVIYRHGDKGKSNVFNSARAQADAEHTSVVCGHFHQQGGISFGANAKHRWFGMQVGCGCETNSPYLRYAKQYAGKQIVGCGIVLDGEFPIFEPMPLEQY